MRAPLVVKLLFPPFFFILPLFYSLDLLVSQGKACPVGSALPTHFAEGDSCQWRARYSLTCPTAHGSAGIS